MMRCRINLGDRPDAMPSRHICLSSEPSADDADDDEAELPKCGDCGTPLRSMNGSSSRRFIGGEVESSASRGGVRGTVSVSASVRYVRAPHRVRRAVQRTIGNRAVVVDQVVRHLELVGFVVEVLHPQLLGGLLAANEEFLSRRGGGGVSTKNTTSARREVEPSYRHEDLQHLVVDLGDGLRGNVRRRLCEIRREVLVEPGMLSERHIECS